MHFFVFGVLFWLASNGNSILPDTANDYKMIVTWGKPLNATASTVLTISWDDCVQKCWTDTKCALVHDTSPTCQYYTIDNVTSVQKLTAASGKRVAFRLLSRNSTCSSPQTEPLLKDGTVKSDSDYTMGPFSQYLPYNITLKNNVWTFGKRSQPHYCFAPQVPVRKNGYVYCMLLSGHGSCLNRTFADYICKMMSGSPLAGPANEAEYDFIKNTAMKHLTDPSPGTVPGGYAKYGFWLDGVRKADCTIPQKAGVTCSGNSEFTFSDPNAQNPALKWNSGQPDGLKGTNAGCVAFLAQNSNPGVDDMACDKATFPAMNLCMVGYYCGTKLGPDDL